MLYIFIKFCCWRVSSGPQVDLSHAEPEDFPICVKQVFLVDLLVLVFFFFALLCMSLKSHWVVGVFPF